MTHPNDLSELVKIEDPQFYLNDPYPIYARLRQEAPVFYYEPLDCFVITKYEDARYITKTHELFSNGHGMFLPDIRLQQQIHEDVGTGAALFPASGEQIGFTDPPRHGELRRVISPALTGRAVTKMGEAIRRYCQEIVGQIEPNQIIDWVPLASVLPVRSAALLLGLPDDNVNQLRFWSDALERAVGAQSPEALDAAGKDFAPIYDYIRSFLDEKAKNPGDDLLSILMTAELDNDRVSEDNVLMFAVTMLAAGSDTTRSLLSGLVAVLSAFPDQLAKVVADRELVPGAIEECLRWITPARGFVKWVREDTELRGQKLRRGQFLYVLYAAASRDEEIFDHPETFDVTRKANSQHMAFGHGPHVCIGAHLVRLETKILLNELLDRYPRFEVAGEPTRIDDSALRSGWKSVPAVFHG
jgi:cytochrome P450